MMHGKTHATGPRLRGLIIESFYSDILKLFTHLQCPSAHVGHHKLKGQVIETGFLRFKAFQAF